MFIVFGNIQELRLRSGKVKVRLRLTLNAKSVGSKIFVHLFLASNVKAPVGTGTYPPYVMITLPIGTRLSGVALFL